MYKAVSLILCLLAVLRTVAGQQPTPHRPAPSPAGQQTLSLTKEQLDWVLKIARERVPERGTVSVPSQNPLTPFATMSPLGSLLDVTEDVRKYGPLGPNGKYGIGAVGEERGMLQSANGPTSPSTVWNLPNGFNHPLDKAFSQALGGINQSIEAINQIQHQFYQFQQQVDQLQRLIAASNQPPVPSPAVGSILMPRNTVGVTALAATHASPDMRRLDRAGLPKSGRLIVRSNPKGYYVGALDVNQNDQFQVKAVKNDKEGCWALGDTLGTVKLHDVWVNCNGLKGEFGNVRPATDSEIPNPGYQSARHLEDTFASLIAPVTNADKKGRPKDAKEFAVLTRDATLYGNYPLSQSPNLPVGQFSDDLGVVVHARRCNDFFKVRYFSNDGRAAVGKYVHINSQTGERIEIWGILDMANISLPLSLGPPPCKQ
jgi:hypothetical protein